MSQNYNSSKIYTSSSSAGLNTGVLGIKTSLTVEANKAKSYEELAQKYCAEAKKYLDDTKKYAEQNTNVKFEHLSNLQNSLIEQINTKQDKGDYALTSEIPSKVSELINDSEYVNQTELSQLLPSKEGAENMFLKVTEDGLEWCAINSFNFFDTKLSDSILEGEAAFGWALQGTYTLSSYADFYQKCLEEKNAGIETQTTLGSSTITTYNNANGHIFFDIADKAVVDEFYNTYGACWMYGIDEENERVFLPRNDWFEQCSSNETGKYQKGGITDHTHYMFASGSPTTTADANTNLLNNSQHVSSVKTVGYSAYALAPSVLNATVGISGGVTTETTNTVQPPAVKKLLYICVGNTVVNAGKVDVEKLVGEIQAISNNFSSITTDLNNVTENQNWVISNRLLSNAAAIGNYTVDLSQILPDDGHMYEILLSYIAYHTNESYTQGRTFITNEYLMVSGGDSGGAFGYMTSGTDKYQEDGHATGIVPIGKARNFTIHITGVGHEVANFYMYGYRKLGKY